MSEKNIAPLPAFPTITTEMIKELAVLIEFIKPAEFRNQLVNFYLQFIISDSEGLPGEFKEMTNSFYLLIEFFTGLQEAMDRR